MKLDQAKRQQPKKGFIRFFNWNFKCAAQGWNPSRSSKKEFYSRKEAIRWPNNSNTKHRWCGRAVFARWSRDRSPIGKTHKPSTIRVHYLHPLYNFLAWRVFFGGAKKKLLATTTTQPPKEQQPHLKNSRNNYNLYKWLQIATTITTTTTPNKRTTTTPQKYKK